MVDWDSLEEYERNCTKCNLCKNRTKVLLGNGNKATKIMLVAEVPGQTEDLEGVPFVGKSGKILDQLLEEVALSRNDIYITNIVKCHPPQNRNP